MAPARPGACAAGDERWPQGARVMEGARVPGARHLPREALPAPVGLGICVQFGHLPVPAFSHSTEARREMHIQSGLGEPHAPTSLSCSALWVGPAVSWDQRWPWQRPSPPTATRASQEAGGTRLEAAEGPPAHGARGGHRPRARAPTSGQWERERIPQFLQQAKDWLLGVPGDAPAWVTSLEAELHSDLVLSKEQRLQVSKELVDLQIATHHLREQHEAELFMLRSEVLRLESRVLELELQGRPGQGHGHEAPRLQVQPRPPELEQKFRRNLVRGQEHLLGGLEQTLEQQQALETQVAALGRQLQGAREEARMAGQRVAIQAVALSACRGQLHQAEAENSRLQVQLKRLNEEYAVRLQRCAQDVADWAGGAGQAPDTAALRTFLETTLADIRAAHRSREHQLARAARAYRQRLADLSRRHEELLVTHRPQAAVSAPGHEAQPPVGGQAKAAGEAPGPAEQGPLQRGKSRGLRTLLFPTEAHQGEMPEPRARPWSHQGAGPLPPPQGSLSVWSRHNHGSVLCLVAEKDPAKERSWGRDAAAWAQIRQELQDFSRGTQAELERERARLLVRATVAEEQLSELQEYVDQHLHRYKQEILRLRVLLGAGVPYKVGTMPLAMSRHPRTHSR